MKPLLTSDLKVKFLGITPVLKDKAGVLNPQEIISLSALLTFRGKSIKKILQEIRKKGKNLNEEIQSVLQKSSLRGHASMSTTPSLCIVYEGSKFLDWALTGLVFSSSLVSSGRRTDTSEKDIVYPQGIYSNKKAKEIYYRVSKENIKFHNYCLSKGISKDEIRKILQQGIYGTGIIQLPIESILAVKRECEAEKDWMPDEVGLLIKEIEKKLKEFGADLLYTTRSAAPRNIYPYPNIFKNPEKPNLARELKNKEKLEKGTKIISMDILELEGLKKKLITFEKKCKKIFCSTKQIKKEWLNLSILHQEILRDYNLALRFKVLSTVPLGIWTEKKRHRTVPEVVESLYFCAERAVKKFNTLRPLIKNKRITPRLIKEIEEVISLPPSIKKNPELLNQYISNALKSFQGYSDLIKLKIKPKEAVFLIPRGTKIDVLQDFDLYNLLAGYYPIRLCATADEEMRRNTLEEVRQLKEIFKERGLGWLNRFLVPKCETIGFCPEVKTCLQVKKSVKDYDEKFHQEMKEELTKKFKENLKNLGKPAKIFQKKT